MPPMLPITPVASTGRKKVYRMMVQGSLQTSNPGSGMTTHTAILYPCCRLPMFSSAAASTYYHSHVKIVFYYGMVAMEGLSSPLPDALRERSFRTAARVMPFYFWTFSGP